MKQKEFYSGLATKRFEVESSPVMGTSKTNIKVKTMDVSGTTTEWEETPGGDGTLTTSISSEVF